ncbi:hybrid sensor histidine kinase/response regulator [Lysobacter sp. TY2-98]|uniref:sensor histidine kinase n=1 Tax=Lysobacter sp. TY2-98 TaxID=2290922 RepID=UPI000E20C095|nr:hybrid sensor histidine kinase/response regulator [Lysobacter sp. TY2-98]AXK73467.1 hybrid sensor histidine kinase/response regulator [Lysobacter sp. TY2-98]
MDRALRILWVEDSAADAELFASLLEDEGVAHAYERVEDEAGLREALAVSQPDLVISDSDLPGFSGEHALRIVRERAPHLPFVFLSGAMGEDAAVLALQQGATDYVLKQNPRRLASAVLRAVREAEAIADRERAHRELMHAQRNEALALLVAGLSHDLRNVLQPLSLLPTLLRAKEDRATALRVADIVEEAARRGHDLAQAMVDYARGRHQEAGHADLAEVLASVRILLGGSVPRSIGVSFPVVAPGMMLAIDATALQQCLLNLCLNGLQAMDGQPSGELTVRADVQHDLAGDVVRIEVCDTGCGIPADVLPHLFTPFFTTKTQGTGLGLLSCRRIIESAGGRLDIDSVPGAGTTMRLVLPLAPANTPVSTPA